MRKRAVRFVSGSVVLLASFAAFGGRESAADTPLPAPDATALVAAEAEYLTTKLGNMPNNAPRTLKTTAMLIALVAQEQGDTDLRDKAVAVAEAIAKKDYAGAQKLAKELPPLKPGGKVSPIDLTQKANFDLTDLMDVFRLDRGKGGRSHEKEVRDHAKKIPDPKKAALLAYKIAKIADYTEVMVPTSLGGKKTKENWTKYSQEMRDLAMKAGQAAAGAKGMDKAATAAFKKLDANCTACHNIFRDDL
jgi:hypothetical protein